MVLYTGNIESQAYEQAPNSKFCHNQTIWYSKYKNYDSFFRWKKFDFSWYALSLAVILRASTCLQALQTSNTFKHADAYYFFSRLFYYLLQKAVVREYTHHDMRSVNSYSNNKCMSKNNAQTKLHLPAG